MKSEGIASQARYPKLYGSLLKILADCGVTLVSKSDGVLIFWPLSKMLFSAFEKFVKRNVYLGENFREFLQIFLLW